MSKNPFKQNGSVANRRRARKGWTTRRAIATELSVVAVALASQPARTNTTGLTVERTAKDGSRAALDFSHFYGEIADWTDSRRRNVPAFEILPAFPLSVALAEILTSGATIHTGRAAYKLSMEVKENV